MPGFRSKLNRKFESFGKIVIQYRWAIILLHLLLCGLLLSELPQLRIVTTVESLFYPQDKTLHDYHEFRDQFGRGDTAILLIKSPDIFSIPFLTHLKQFHNDLKNSVPFLNQISSLANARYMVADQGQTFIRHFLEVLPGSPAEAIELKQLALNYPSYEGIYFTEDLQYAIVSLKTEAVSRLSEDGSRISIFTPPGRPLSISQIENSAILGIVQAVMQEYEFKDFQIYLSGTPAYQSHVEPLLKSGMKNLSILVLVLTAVFMSILFGRVSGVFLPQFVVVMGLIITLGIMALNGASLTSTTSMLPAFLLSVGLTAPIHFLVVFFKFQGEGDRLNAIVSTLGHSGVPIVMTSVTTAAGFLSFSYTDIAPVADLGIYSALGVMICLSLTLFFLPALMAVLNIRPGKAREKRYDQSAYNRLLMGMGRFGVEHPLKTVLIAFGIALVLSSGILKINFSHHMLDYLLDDSEFKKNTAVDRKRDKRL
ncbi:MAG: MMPL family transporter [SAR324 cluster bacterium]|nr:MMPL family transporter [SAR324 cluster bacterium]